MILKNLLSQGNWIVYPRNIGKKIGVEETIILMQLIHASENFETKWFFQTAEKLEDLTGITYKRQKRCIEKLAELKLIETKLEGLPRKRYFRINEMAIQELLIGSSQYCPNGRTVSAETEEQGMPDGQSIYNKINKEESTEEDQINKTGDFFENENHKNSNDLETNSKKEKKKFRQKEKKEGAFEGDQRSLVMKMFECAKSKGLVCSIGVKDEKESAVRLKNTLIAYIQDQKKDEGHPEWSVKDHEILDAFEIMLDNAEKFHRKNFSFAYFNRHCGTILNGIKNSSKKSKAQFMQELYDDLQNREYDF